MRSKSFAGSVEIIPPSSANKVFALDLGFSMLSDSNCFTTIPKAIMAKKSLTKGASHFVINCFSNLS